MSNDIRIRLFVIILAMLQPLIIIYMFGVNVKSISSVWTSDLQPLFVITNALTSFLLYQHRKWIPASILLLLLTAFSVEKYPFIHNWLSYGFFLSCLFPMLEKERYYIYPSLFLGSLIFWVREGFFWMEFWAIYVISIYHLHLLYIRYKYETRNN